ncbi:hypothetical protein Tsubulata_037616 [Turnera subulata]|uniref:Uncharacterized protein n=1 Tax=Turnera subulata TaxID=218843 RepID=A0A9Q0J7S0_9ROSI|nr:hypothetical protein Tsubulata_037616 [Turnera subulata]
MLRRKRLVVLAWSVCFLFIDGSAVPAVMFSSKLIHRFSDEAKSLRISDAAVGDDLWWPKRNTFDYVRLLLDNNLKRKRMSLGSKTRPLFPAQGSRTLFFGNELSWEQFLFSFDAAEELKQAIAAKNHKLVYLYSLNLVDEIWKETRPKPPNKSIRVHDLKYAGMDASSKLSFLRSELLGAGSSAIRGGVVPHSPVTYAYLVVEIDGAKLFCG